jgi:hypothetical protein
MLLSASTSGGLPLVGIAQGTDYIVVEVRARGRNHQPPLLADEIVAGNGLDPESCSVGSDLDLTGDQAQAVAQQLGNNQSACLVNGCTHAIRIPSPRRRARLGDGARRAFSTEPPGPGASDKMCVWIS